MKRDHVKTVGNRTTILHDGQVIPLLGLGEVLGIVRKNGNKPVDDLKIVVISHSGKKMAFHVDELVDEQEIMIKSPGKHLARLKSISGVTVSGDGKVVPIINVNHLMSTAPGHTALHPAEKVPKSRSGNVSNSPAKDRAGKISSEAPNEAGKSHAVLVAEDSITARTLLKSILDTEGYHVTTAVDGADAYTKVMHGQFDIVVTDVDMPGMSGFELTQKIRANKKTASLPVVLVTSLDSEEDKKHGIDAGADAYIVKESFDQSNLLQVIQQLL